MYVCMCVYLNINRSMDSTTLKNQKFLIPIVRRKEPDVTLHFIEKGLKTLRIKEGEK